eukprot:TRINITY_DN18386_c0_g1_i1.p1 TRINITY_DN18386_c0_g1~~TRINITY_DN18386_c0_g1_i1.p1  ORF type:complete len:1099 (+),score=210.25 TRINITY_DN18386_c0_g1_i1:139-3435(+)
MQGTRGGGAPALAAFRTEKHKVSHTWEDMQRRVARRAGLVQEFEDRPRLLAAADEMTPSAWERSVDCWPDVARTSARLRPPTGAMLESVGNAKEDDKVTAELEDMIPWLTEALGEDFVAEHLPLTPSAGVSAVSSPSPSTPAPGFRTPRHTDAFGFRTPPSVYIASTRQLGMRQELEKALNDLKQLEKGQAGKDSSRLAGSGLEGEVRDFSPRTSARQQFDLHSDPFSAADEFRLARRRAKRKTVMMKRLDRDKLGLDRADAPALKHTAITNPADTLASETAMQQPMTARDKIIDRLEYVNTCREIMGDERFSNERKRFEMNSQLRSAAKYSVEEKPPDLRSTFSAQVRGLIQDDEIPEWKAGKTTGHRSSQQRPSTAPQTPADSFVPGGGSSNEFLQQRPSTSDAPFAACRDRNQPDLARRAFYFASSCKDNRVPMPFLGAFSVATPQATPRQRNESQEKPMELSLPHWSLGDKPLIALASSPMKDCLATVEEGGLRGNRITNEGLSALVANLGNTTTLDLSENRFDSRGASALVGFLKSNQSLRELTLSRNRLSDESVAALCRKMGECCPVLAYVGLSDVQFGVGMLTGPALGMLLETAPRLRGLDLSFNMLQGSSAIPFLEGLNNASVEHLDVGWNCLGQGSKSAQVAELLALVLRDSGSLYHLDISFNRFKSQDAGVLARGLRTNRTLWGIHLEGNSAVLDADGFMQTVSDEIPASTQPPLTDRDKKKKGKGGKKAKSARGKDTTEAEAETSAFGLTPEEMEVRARALQNHISAMDESSAWQVKWEEMERYKKTRGELSDKFGFTGTTSEKASGKRYGVPLPAVLGERGFGEAMDPRKQDAWLQSLSNKVKPDVCQALRMLGNNARGKHNHTDTMRQDCKCCWLCGAWVEVAFEINSSVSLLDDFAPKPDAPVCVLLSIDNFSRPIPLLQCTDAAGEKCWRGSRFLPPTSEDLHMVLQVGNHLHVLQELTTKDLHQALRLPLWKVGTGAEETTEASHDEILQVNSINVASLAEKYIVAAAAAKTDQVLKQEVAIVRVTRTVMMASAAAKATPKAEVQQPPHAVLPRQRWPTWSRRKSHAGSKTAAPPQSSPPPR